MSTNSIASTREAAADAILEAALKDPKVVFVSADSVKAARATPVGRLTLPNGMKVLTTESPTANSSRTPRRATIHAATPTPH